MTKQEIEYKLSNDYDEGRGDTGLFRCKGGWYVAFDIVGYEKMFTWFDRVEPIKTFVNE